MGFYIVDIISAIIVIVAVFLKFRSKRIWAVYSVTCFSYSYLNFAAELYGQSTMNVIIGVIAVRNFFYFERMKSHD